MRLFFAILLVSALVLTGLWVLLPWWGFGLALGAGGVAARLARRGLERRAIRHRTQALEGARLEVCSIAPTHFPGFIKGLDEADEATDPRRYFLVELVVEPGPDASTEAWTPGDLKLVPAAGSPSSGEEGEGEPVEIFELTLARGEDWVGEAGAEIQGPAKLRLHIGVIPGTEGLTLEYASARLGEIRLPPD